jgi:hypothetical protein
MSHNPVRPSLPDHALEHIRNNDKKVRGKGVPLMETISTADPVPGHSIEEHRRKASLQDGCHPATPAIVKPSRSEDAKEAIPVDRVKGFFEVNLENDRRRLFEVAAVNKVRSVDDVF